MAMNPSPIRLTRGQILAYRRAAQALDARLPPGASSHRTAAWAGLQDSMPRAALLSIHARVEGTTPSALDDASLVQVWGPRFSAYVVSARDVAPFTLGRLPDDPRRRQRAEETAARLHAFLDGREMPDGESGRGALLMAGEIVGTWRRSNAVVTVEPWRRLSRADRDAVEAEAAWLPLPGLQGPISVQWGT